MLPLLRAGEEVLIDHRAYRKRPPEPGDIVVAFDPRLEDFKIIKRVQHVTEEGGVFLVGDNPGQSTDSRVYGVVAPDQIIGRVVCRFGGG